MKYRSAISLLIQKRPCIHQDIFNMQQGNKILFRSKFYFNTIRPNRVIAAAITIIATLFLQNANAQYALKLAREQDSLYNYAKAIPLYEKAYMKKPTAEAARGIAGAYFKQRAFVDAMPWYAKLVAMEDHTLMDEFFYAQNLMSSRQYPEAKTVLSKLDTTNIAINHTLIANMIAGCDSAVYWAAHPVKGDLANLEKLNSRQSDWGATNYKGNIIFASSRPVQLKRKEPFFRNTSFSPSTYGWTGDSYQHIYSGNTNDSAGISIFDTAIAAGFYHIANASFTADGNEMFFAVTRYIKKKAKFIGKEYPYHINIEIYYTAWDAVKSAWKQPVRFPYDDILQNSMGDPFITPDGKTLYFVSDAKENSFGGTDIYYSKRTRDTSWATPVNMGDSINTPGNERTPFLDSAGNLYFASDGHIGMGGLDIYKATPDANGGWQIVNAGVPVNSPQDDFTPYFTNGYKGYFASNRLLGKGGDDIYRFNAARILIFKLEGEVLNTKTRLPVSNATVTLNNLILNAPLTVTTGTDGTFSFMLDSITTYRLTAIKPEYTPSATEDLSTVGLQESTVIHKTLYLDNIIIPPPVIEPIYYNFDKWNIRGDAENPLDHIVQLMKENPNWKLEISSHTDSRGSDNYNMRLSQQRAESVMKYLTDHGIEAGRLSAQGYGETRLVNNCSNRMPCSEAAHQLNRRSEFMVQEK